MNKGKAYSYLGAMLGTGAGFGVGIGLAFAIQFLLYSGIDPAEITRGVIALFCILALIISTFVVATFTKTQWLTVLVLFLVGFLCVSLAIKFGTSYRPSYRLVQFNPLFSILFAIPYAALGTIKGYLVGRSIGEKAEKINEYKTKYEQLKGEGYEPDEELEVLLK